MDELPFIYESARGGLKVFPKLPKVSPGAVSSFAIRGIFCKNLVTL
jgi:hypothetical protein